MGKRSVFELVQRWIAVGQELGQKELERQSVPVTPTHDSLQEARNQWAKTVGAIAAMLQMSELLGELPPGVKQHVMEPLRAATERRPPRRSLMSLDAVQPPVSSSRTEPPEES